MRLAPTATLTAATLLALLQAGCEGPSRSGESEASIADSESPEDRDPMVGYDLRRLRPREGESLAVMFDRVRAKANQEHKRVVVLFSADWCEPCKMLDLELGNTHPASMIGDVRILELKEDEWAEAARMDEFNELRRRWEPALGSYPLVLLLDPQGERREEMKEARDRLEEAGVGATLPVWFEETRLGASG